LLLSKDPAYLIPYMRIYTFIIGFFGGLVKLFGAAVRKNLFEKGRGMDWGLISAGEYLTFRG